MHPTLSLGGTGSPLGAAEAEHTTAAPNAPQMFVERAGRAKDGHGP